MNSIHKRKMTGASYPLCGQVIFGRSVFDWFATSYIWRRVTCKRCLRIRKAVSR